MSIKARRGLLSVALMGVVTWSQEVPWPKYLGHSS
jgi:hypothetical protein